VPAVTRRALVAFAAMPVMTLVLGGVGSLPALLGDRLGAMRGGEVGVEPADQPGVDGAADASTAAPR
jgi:hypothetical protein